MWPSLTSFVANQQKLRDKLSSLARCKRDERHIHSVDEALKGEQ
jgi:hypothetical protein